MWDDELEPLANTPNVPWWTKAPVLTDVTIIVGSEKHEYELHKIILISRSDFLSVACLNTRFKEGQTSRIELPDITPEIFEIIIYWLYSMRIRYSLENCGKDFRTDNVTSASNIERTLSLVEAANFLGMWRLKEDLWRAVINDYEVDESLDYNAMEFRRLRAMGMLYGYRKGSRITIMTIGESLDLIREKSRNRHFAKAIKKVEEGEEFGFEFVRDLFIAYTERHY